MPLGDRALSSRFLFHHQIRCGTISARGAANRSMLNSARADSIDRPLTPTTASPFASSEDCARGVVSAYAPPVGQLHEYDHSSHQPLPALTGTGSFVPTCSASRGSGSCPSTCRDEELEGSS